MTSKDGLTLSQIDFGSADAESDRRLSEYFGEEPYVEAALSLEGTQILGRKGSGKSALFSQLNRLLESKGQHTIVLKLSPDQYSWAALKEYKEQGLMPEQAHTNAWKFAIATAVAGALAGIPNESLTDSSSKEVSRPATEIH